MTKGETIEYAIKKKCQEYSLVDWCEEWGISIHEFRYFLECGRIGFDRGKSYNGLNRNH